MYHNQKGVMAMETKHFKTGDVIFRENSFDSTMYEIKSGSVSIYSAYGTPDEQKLTELGAGRIFGEMGVIEVYPRSATAVASADTEAEEISTADLQEYFNSRPERLMEIMRGTSRRLRELTADYQEVCKRLGEWQAANESGAEKSSALMSAIRKFAAAFSGKPASV